MSATIHPKLRPWIDRLDRMTYYQMLGLRQSATDQEVRGAFRRFALWFHPDRHRDAPSEDQEAVATIFRRGTQAYRVLSQTELRGRYDLALARGHLTLEDGSLNPPAAPGHARSIADLCRTPAARLRGQEAERLIQAGQLREARAALNEAISQDGGENPDLEERLDDLDTMLFVKGD